VVEDLARSGLTARDAKRLGIEFVPANRADAFGRQRPLMPESYLIPYFDLDGHSISFSRQRFLAPYVPPGEKKERRYTQPAGASPRFYLAPLGVRWQRIATDPATPLFVTEGEKKAAALCKLGIPTIGLGGVWNWCQREGAGEPSAPLDDFNRFDWHGRSVKIAFDSDAQFKTSVQHAIRALAAELIKRGAIPSAVQLPQLNGSTKTGADDFLVHNGFGAKARKEFLALPEEPLLIPRGSTFAELAVKKLPEPRWAVAELIPVGLTVLAGHPKIGKSWLALNLSVAVATGDPALGTYETRQGGVLHLALEDTERRFQDRLKRVLNGRGAPGGAHVHYRWPRVEEGGLDALRRWLDQHPDTRLIIIDTLALMRPRPRGNANTYYEDYDAVRQLKAIADEHEVGIVAVHHLRKAASDDPLEQVSGTTGNTGAADTILVLKRARGQDEGTLFVSGRDVVERELAVRFDPAHCTWSDLGDAIDHRISNERRLIIETLKSIARPAAPHEIAELINKKRGAVKKLMLDMANGGQLIWGADGRYELKGGTKK